MPHSSGGGHHGGGHHGGHSHHRSSSRSRSSGSSAGTSRISRRPFSGARRYRYRHFGRTRYIYSTADPSKRFSALRLLLVIFYIPFILVLAYAMKTTSYKGFSGYSDHSIIVRDELNVLGDTSELNDVLKKFRDKTEITPAVVTVDADAVKKYDSLEDYAYQRYLKEFDDEMHWLIVYTELPDRSDWSFEGMQGDDTDPVLTGTVTNSFNKKLYNDLEADTSSPRGKIIAAAFSDLLPKVSKPSFWYNLKTNLPFVGFLLFILLHMFLMLGLGDLKYRKAVYDPENGAPEPDALKHSSPAGNTPVNASPEIRYTAEFSGEAKICPSCGMTCDPDEKKCPICGTRL